MKSEIQVLAHGFTHSPPLARVHTRGTRAQVQLQLYVAPEVLALMDKHLDSRLPQAQSGKGERLQIEMLLGYQGESPQRWLQLLPVYRRSTLKFICKLALE